MLKLFLPIAIFFSTQLFSQTLNIDKIFEKNTNVIVYLHKTGCPYCERLEEFTLDDDDVHNYIEKNYSFISINVSFDNDVVIFQKKKFTPKKFAQTVGYNFYPSVLFYTPNKQLVYSTVGYLEEKEFLLILQYVHTKAYTQMTLDEYKKQTGFKAEEE